MKMKKEPLKIAGVTRSIKSETLIFNIHFTDGTYGTYEIFMRNLIKNSILINSGFIKKN